MPCKTATSVVDDDLIVGKKINLVFSDVGLIVPCNAKVTTKDDAPRGLVWQVRQHV